LHRLKEWNLIILPGIAGCPVLVQKCETLLRDGRERKRKKDGIFI